MCKKNNNGSRGSWSIGMDLMVRLSATTEILDFKCSPGIGGCIVQNPTKSIALPMQTLFCFVFGDSTIGIGWEQFASQ